MQMKFREACQQVSVFESRAQLYPPFDAVDADHIGQR
jgi:hypothetical protein